MKNILHRKAIAQPSNIHSIAQSFISIIASALLSVLLSLNPAYAAEKTNCLTSSDIEGPYYVANAPFRSVITTANEPGQHLYISGVVYANDCKTPIADAVIDVWQTNDQGCYSIVEKHCKSQDRFHLRGKLRTDAKGRYNLETIKPGRYGEGGSIRPSHIHFKIWVKGGSVLTTQLYFKGDEYIAGDPWASLPKAANRTIPLEKRDQKLYGEFNIVVDMAPISTK